MHRTCHWLRQLLHLPSRDLLCCQSCDLSLYICYIHHFRDARSAHWWNDHKGVVGGRDCVGGGTWFCASTKGRAAFITNVRDQSLVKRGAPSRGELPLNFVTGTQSPLEYVSSIPAESYSGFNLVVVDLTEKCSAGDGSSQMYYLTNAPKHDSRIIPMVPGIHGLSNAVLNTPWPKVVRGTEILNQLINQGIFAGDKFPWESIFALMHDRTKLETLETEDTKLPETGYGAAFEAAVSAIFTEPVELDGLLFGTRSTTILAVRRDGFAELRERYLTADGGWAEERHTFQMDIYRS